MTDNLEAANVEREELISEIKFLRDHLNDKFGEYTHCPIGEFEKKCMLIRLGILDNSLKYLDRLISNELENFTLEQLIPSANGTEKA